MIVKAEGNQVLISSDNPLDVGPVAPPDEDNQDSWHDSQEGIMEVETGNKDQDDWNQAAQGYHAGD